MRRAEPSGASVVRFSEELHEPLATRERSQGEIVIADGPRVVVTSTVWPHTGQRFGLIQWPPQPAATHRNRRNCMSLNIYVVLSSIECCATTSEAPIRRWGSITHVETASSPAVEMNQIQNSTKEESGDTDDIDVREKQEAKQGIFREGREAAYLHA